MQKFVLILALFLVGCGKRETGPFESYVQAFEAAAIEYKNPQNVLSLSIKFSTDIKTSENAKCNREFLATPEILVNETKWVTMTEEQREILIFHELGHCIMGKSHADEEFAVMNTELPSGWHSKRDQLLSDFFKD